MIASAATRRENRQCQGRGPERGLSPGLLALADGAEFARHLRNDERAGGKPRCRNGR